MPVPRQPKIYHIVHVDRLKSISQDGCLWCDAEIFKRSSPGTSIGMSGIKRRRLYDLSLTSYPDNHVGDFVPFYFCPRSVMLYLINRGNHPDLDYRGGQEPILHLQADLYAAVKWAEQNKRRWAFTLSNAGSFYFEDRCSLAHLGDIDWDAVHANQWGGPGVSLSVKEGKQAEFLMEYRFPWCLVERIGVISHRIHDQVSKILCSCEHIPRIQVKSNWYY
jgi:hypothetical protein